MKNKYKFLILILIALISVGFLTYPASAESGSIVISDETTADYSATPTFAHDTWTQGDWLRFDSANINYISSFRVNYSGIGMNYAHEFEESECHITEGGTGSWLWFSYNKNDKHVHYVFSSDTILTSSPLKFLCHNASITQNVSHPDTSQRGYEGENDWSQGKVYRNSSYGCQPIGDYEDVITGIRATDFYTVTYPYANQFSVSVIKTQPSINSKYKFEGLNSVYGEESTYNSVSFDGASFPQTDGIILNATLASGIYTKVWVNMSGVSGYVPDTTKPPLQPDPITGVGISFDKYNYYVGSQANISWIRTINTPFGYTDAVTLYRPDGTTQRLAENPANSGNVSRYLSLVGTYKVSFERYILGVYVSTLDSDQASVIAEGTTYILMNTSVPAKTQVPIKYHIGYSLTGYVNGNYSMMMLEVRKYVDGNYISPIYYNILSNDGTISHSFYSEGSYKVSIYDYLRGEQKTEQIVTVVLIPSSIPLEKIKTSYITVDKLSFYKGEMITGSYGVDDKNYTNYTNHVEIISSTTSEVFCAFTGGSNFDLITGTFGYDFSPQSGEYYTGCAGAIGANTVMLYGINSSGKIFLASSNYTTSLLNEDGYSLTLIKTADCKKIIVKTLVPSGVLGQLSILRQDNKVVKNYTVSGNLTTTIVFTSYGSYTINLYSPGGTLEISEPISIVGNCVGTAPPTITPGTGGLSASTSLDLLSSPWFWGSILVFVFAIAGAASAGIIGFVGGLSLGVIFAFLGGFIPLWALFVFVLIVILCISIVISSKTTNGGG